MLGGSCNALALFGSSGFELTLKSAPRLPCLAGESIAAARPSTNKHQGKEMVKRADSLCDFCVRVAKAISPAEVGNGQSSEDETE